MFVCVNSVVVIVAVVAEKAIVVAKSVAERLVQRLVCYAGTQDVRFASKFLISCCNNTHQQVKQNLLYVLFVASFFLRRILRNWNT